MGYIKWCQLDLSKAKGQPNYMKWQKTADSEKPPRTQVGDDEEVSAWAHESDQDMVIVVLRVEESLTDAMPPGGKITGQ